MNRAAARFTEPVPNLSVATDTGLARFRTGGTGSAPILSGRAAVFAAASRYIRTETKIWNRSQSRGIFGRSAACQRSPRETFHHRIAPFCARVMHF